MSGKVRAGSPWMRAALSDFALIHPDTLADIEERIEDGAHIALICDRRPRPLGAILIRGYEQVARVEPAYHSVGAACFAVLAAAREAVA